MWRRIVSLVLFIVGFWGISERSALAQEVELEDEVAMREPARYFIGAGGGMYAKQPGSSEDPGVSVLAGRGLWYGPVWGLLQCSARTWAQLGLGSSGRFYSGVAAGVGFELFLGRYLSLDAYVGPALGVQAAQGPTMLTAGFSGMGGWGLHPFDDVRQTLRLGILMRADFSLYSSQEDQGANDCPGCPALVMHLGYEAPF